MWLLLAKKSDSLVLKSTECGNLARMQRYTSIAYWGKQSHAHNSLHEYTGTMTTIIMLVACTLLVITRGWSWNYYHSGHLYRKQSITAVSVWHYTHWSKKPQIIERDMNQKQESSQLHRSVLVIGIKSQVSELFSFQCRMLSSYSQARQTARVHTFAMNIRRSILIHNANYNWV